MLVVDFQIPFFLMKETALTIFYGYGILVWHDSAQDKTLRHDVVIQARSKYKQWLSWIRPKMGA